MSHNIRVSAGVAKEYQTPTISKLGNLTELVQTGGNKGSLTREGGGGGGGEEFKNK